jgi:hypothetical protein
MGGFEEILHQDEVDLPITHDLRHALDGIKIHHDSGRERLNYGRNVLPHHDHGFDDSSNHRYLISIDYCGVEVVIDILPFRAISRTIAEVSLPNNPSIPNPPQIVIL